MVCAEVSRADKGMEKGAQAGEQQSGPAASRQLIHLLLIL